VSGSLSTVGTVTSNLGTIGSIISLITTIVVIVGGLWAVRSRRQSRENRELREVRDTNVAAMGYIYEMEMALGQASRRYNFTVNIEKPEVLKKDYIQEQADATQNTELQSLLTIMQTVQNLNPVKPLISGEKLSEPPN
jgi:FtsZ-interacting cell division protein ZipA